MRNAPWRGVKRCGLRPRGWDAGRYSFVFAWRVDPVPHVSISAETKTEHVHESESWDNEHGSHRTSLRRERQNTVYSTRYGAESSRQAAYLLLTFSFVSRDLFIFGSRSMRTPCFSDASAWSGSISSGRTTVRENEPQ